MKHLIILGIALIGLTAVAGDDSDKNQIIQKDKAFSVNEITIKPGEKLVFKNADEVAHNVFSISKDNPFTIKVQKPGESTPVWFTNAGVTEVRCSIHPKMKLVVTVKE